MRVQGAAGRGGDARQHRGGPRHALGARRRRAAHPRLLRVRAAPSPAPMGRSAQPCPFVQQLPHRLPTAHDRTPKARRQACVLSSERLARAQVPLHLRRRRGPSCAVAVVADARARLHLRQLHAHRLRERRLPLRGAALQGGRLDHAPRRTLPRLRLRPAVDGAHQVRRRPRFRARFPLLAWRCSSQSGRCSAPPPRCMCL